ncbi:hypothetical protein DUG83_23580 [Vibrio parahaemolyticus]|nr:hypothetical protein [Vibrio parahaemolyticus]
MNNIFYDLMGRILVESGFSLARVVYADNVFDFSSYIYIGHKPKNDYFVYIDIPVDLLPYVNNDIQIKLASLFKGRGAVIENMYGDDLNISSSFEKNSTLIISSNYDANIGDDVSKQAITIEEDPYFFKKHVIIFSEKELEFANESINDLDSEDSYVSYLQRVISDATVFNEFAKKESNGFSVKVNEYSFVAKLYEKLPFLSLLVESSHPGDLQKMIDSKLSYEQREQCNEALTLDLNNLDSWFSEIIEGN